MAPVTMAAPAELASFSEIGIALTVFILTYAVILTERVNRAIVALLGAGGMILFGILSQQEAIHAIDFNTLGLLLGMMVLVGVMKESGVFQAVAIWGAQAVRAKPVGVLVMLSIVTAVFSALLDNVTTVLLITPVILLLTKELDVQPYPYLFSAILASNIGGSATLIGDPPNIMIGSAAELSFMDFVYNLGPLSAVVMVFTLLPIIFIWRKELFVESPHSARIMKMNAKAAITDPILLQKSLAVMALVLVGFTVGHGMGYEPASIAMGGAALLLLLDNLPHSAEEQNHKVHTAVAEAEWVTLLFFMGLFVLVHALVNVGVIAWLSEHLLAATGGDLAVTSMLILWGSAILSALVDNIPFVATMIPLLQGTMPDFEAQYGSHGADVLWWSLAIGACLGGNGSLIGASANLVVAGFAEKAGHRMTFVKFMLYAFPLMLWSIVIATVYMQWRYL